MFYEQRYWALKIFLALCIFSNVHPLNLCGHLVYSWFVFWFMTYFVYFKKTDVTETRLDGTEKTPLIDEKSTTVVEHSIYGKLQHHKVETTWRHWLIAPVVCLYFFGMMSSFFIVVEYTNEYCKEEEYDKVNLSLSDTSSPCDTNVSDIVTDTEQKATSKASTWLVYFSIASGVPAIFANLIFGSYTDTYGRKFLLAICILGTCLRLAISAIVVYLETDLVYLLIANFVEGCTGQYATCLTVSLAYTADITSPGKSRVNGMILVELLIGIAMSSAGLATGYMIAAIGYKVSLFISAGVLVLAALITITLLPETLSKDLRQKDKSVIEVLKVVLQFFTLNDDKKSRWKYQIIVLVLVLTNVSYMGRMSTETLYQLATPFCWTPAQVGVYAAVKTVAVMFIGKFIIKSFIRNKFIMNTL